jgi:hypothetical protein
LGDENNVAIPGIYGSPDFLRADSLNLGGADRTAPDTTTSHQTREVSFAGLFGTANIDFSAVGPDMSHADVETVVITQSEARNGLQLPLNCGVIFAVYLACHAI